MIEIPEIVTDQARTLIRENDFTRALNIKARPALSNIGYYDNPAILKFRETNPCKSLDLAIVGTSIIHGSFDLGVYNDVDPKWNGINLGLVEGISGTLIHIAKMQEDLLFSFGQSAKIFGYSFDNKVWSREMAMQGTLQKGDATILNFKPHAGRTEYPCYIYNLGNYFILVHLTKELIEKSKIPFYGDVSDSLERIEDDKLNWLNRTVQLHIIESLIMLER